MLATKKRESTLKFLVRDIYNQRETTVLLLGAVLGVLFEEFLVAPRFLSVLPSDANRSSTSGVFRGLSLSNQFEIYSSR